MVAAHRMHSAIVDLHRAGQSKSRISKLLKVNRTTVYRTVKRYQSTNALSDRSKSGRPRTATTPSKIRVVWKRIRQNPYRGINQMAKELKISRRSVQKMVTVELGLHPYRTRKAAILSDKNQKCRLVKSRALLKRMKRDMHHVIVFSGEKLFTVQAIFNSQNHRVLAKDAKEADEKGRVVHRASHPAQVMVWAAICVTGKTDLVFMEPNVKINKEYYLEEILKYLLPWTQSHFNGRHFIFQ